MKNWGSQCIQIGWRRDKVKVFSKEKFYGDNEISDMVKQLSALDGWPEKCDGKTEEECNALGYWVHPDQMEER